MGGICVREEGRANSADTAIPHVKTVLFKKHQQLMKASGCPDYTPWAGPISSKDVLIVVDMQNDFLPAEDYPVGGRFGVAEGASTIAPQIKLIQAFHRAGALVVATRDYHPHDHCSFSGNGGPYPPHCVQGSAGAFFVPPVGAALHKAMHSSDTTPSLRRTTSEAFAPVSMAMHVNQNPGRVEIAYKGFAENVDSFGSFKYSKNHFDDRAAKGNPHCCWDVAGSPSGITCAEAWTGSFCLKCSSQMEDINAPPDVMAVKHTDTRPLDSVIAKQPGGRILITGLAYDVCCLDTAVNACQLGYKDVFMAPDASRAAYIPGVGQFGDGFLGDPAWISSQIVKNGIKLCDSTSVLEKY